MNTNREYSPKKFLMIVAVSTITLIVITTAININIDIFGLFKETKGEKIGIHKNERIGKYLLSYHYIPENFNTLIIGTSLSDNLDVTSYNNENGDYKIYNASILGANIHELNEITHNSIKHNIKNIIFCISPYSMNSINEGQVPLNQKLYYSSLGSKNLYETYIVALIRNYELMPHKYPKDQINEYGVNNYNKVFKKIDVQKKINEEVELHKGEAIEIDSAGIECFKTLISEIKEKQINLIGYFHPLPIQIYESNRENFDGFKELVKSIVQDDSKIIDFNSSEYFYITKDYSNYIDHGHLSTKGQRKIMEILYNKLVNSNKSINLTQEVN